jgi:hypothetical protein
MPQIILVTIFLMVVPVTTPFKVAVLMIHFMAVQVTIIYLAITSITQLVTTVTIFLMAVLVTTRFSAWVAPIR